MQSAEDKAAALVAKLRQRFSIAICAAPPANPPLTSNTSAGRRNLNVTGKIVQIRA